MDIYLSNDNLITLDGLTNAATGSYINDATVTAQLKEADGDDLGASITLAYVAASNGKYQGTLEEDVVSTAGRGYTLHIDVLSGADLRAHIEVPVRAVVRRA